VGRRGERLVVEEHLSAFEAITLEELDEHSALRERVDTKYAVPSASLELGWWTPLSVSPTEALLHGSPRRDRGADR
jgi:hypothetical protein